MAREVGLIGCGNWGSNILRDLVQLGAKVHVATPRPESRKQALDRGAYKVVQESDSLPLLDGYVLATPIPVLFQEAKKLLHRGAPVFSEKTLCTTLDEADELYDSGGQGRIFVMHKWEYHQGVQTLKTILESGRIGELEEIQCYRQNWSGDMHGGDVLSALAVHDLTIVRHILGQIPAPVFSLLSREQGLATRIWAVLGQAPRAVLSISGRHPNYFRTVCLHGSLGAAALVDPLADHLILRDKKGEDKVFFEPSMPLFDELKEFLNYLEGGPEPRCGLERAREVAKVLDGLRSMDRS